MSPFDAEAGSGHTSSAEGLGVEKFLMRLERGSDTPLPRKDRVSRSSL
jgi:hypothetical protein